MTSIHHFDSTGEAYDACQCDDSIKNGDVLVIKSERVVGVAWTWPFAVTARFGKLHRLEDPNTAPEFFLQAGLEAARNVARQLRFKV